MANTRLVSKTDYRQRAEKETLGCNRFIILGSIVYPAAGFPQMAYQNGATRIIVNQQETDLDPIAGVVIHEGMGDTMKATLSGF